MFGPRPTTSHIACSSLLLALFSVSSFLMSKPQCDCSFQYHWTSSCRPCSTCTPAPEDHSPGITQLLLQVRQCPDITDTHIPSKVQTNGLTTCYLTRVFLSVCPTLWCVWGGIPDFWVAGFQTPRWVQHFGGGWVSNPPLGTTFWGWVVFEPPIPPLSTTFWGWVGWHRRRWKKGFFCLGMGGWGSNGSVGRQVVDGQDNTRRGGAIGPRTHGTAARHVVHDLNVEGSENRKSIPATTSTTPVHQLLGSSNAEMTPSGSQAGRAQRPEVARVCPM